MTPGLSLGNSPAYACGGITALPLVVALGSSSIYIRTSRGKLFFGWSFLSVSFSSLGRVLLWHSKRTWWARVAVVPSCTVWVFQARIHILVIDHSRLPRWRDSRQVTPCLSWLTGMYRCLSFPIVTNANIWRFFKRWDANLATKAHVQYVCATESTVGTTEAQQV